MSGRAARLESGPAFLNPRMILKRRGLGHYNEVWIGAWRSLVAHLPWAQGVVGSNPSAPTNGKAERARACSGPALLA